ncbi:MAG TPA: glycosyltransferase family 2 protein [Lachnospiraceae bacterium]|nr:glycosyltransferase family 2 protein [Lachnospiraceae bacterium]HPF28480.1 glycosyltransferase family 2 protein [Lachnospiraceae bacterium]
MNKEPLVTIFVLIYNNPDGLKTTVDSLLNQTYRNAEILLSDDGSTKYDTAILEDYAKRLRKKYHQVRVNVNDKNVGTVRHLNKVFQMAKGEYLFSCSSGDRFHSNTTVECLVEAFLRKNALIITTRRYDVDKELHHRMKPFILVGMALRLAPRKLMNYMVRKRNLLSGCCTFYRKELFEQYGYHDEDYFLVEDYPYYIDLLRRNIRINWSPLVTIDHEIGGVSTGKVHPGIYRDIELLREKLYPIRSEFDRSTRVFLEKCHNKMED